VINGKQVCVRDDSQWKRCEVNSIACWVPASAENFAAQSGHEVTDFVRQIEAEYEKLNA
jgi:hypothetical protein